MRIHTLYPSDIRTRIFLKPLLFDYTSDGKWIYKNTYSDRQTKSGTYEIEGNNIVVKGFSEYYDCPYFQIARIVSGCLTFEDAEHAFVRQ